MCKKILLFSILALICAFSVQKVYAQSDEDMEKAKLILESFCQDHYSSCFSGRTYVESSLTVKKIEQASMSQIKVYGYHSYKGRFGASYSSMDYYAYIKYNPNNTLTIRFYKKSKADLLHSEDYWEDCSKTIYP